jgi:mannosyltransferase
MRRLRESSSKAPGKRAGGYAIALLAILTLAAFLRFYDLGEESLWVDEIYSLSFVSAEDTAQVVSLTYAEDYHPPGYHLILYYWRALAGESEAALRFPSAVAGVLSVLAIYLLGSRLYSEREGIAAALFMAVLRYPVFYSQEARSYSLVILFSTLSAYFWWGCLQGLRGSRRLPTWEAIAYVVSAVVLCYLHYFGLLLVAFQAAALLLLAPRAILRVILLYTPVGIAYLPWVPAVLWHASGGAREPWLWSPTLSDALWFLRDLFNYSLIPVLVAYALLLLGALRALYDLRGRSFSFDALLPDGLLAVWFVVPPVLIYVISLVSTPLYFPRYLIICLPAVYLLLARAVFLLFRRPLAGEVAAAALAALFLGHMVLGLHYYSAPEKEQYREAAAYAVSQATPHTVMAQCGWGGWWNLKNFPDRYDYYFKRAGSMDGPGPQICSREELQAFLGRLGAGSYDRFIYLRLHVPGTEPVQRALRERFGPPHREDFIGGEVWVYDVGDEEKAQGQLKQKLRSEQRSFRARRR